MSGGFASLVSPCSDGQAQEVVDHLAAAGLEFAWVEGGWEQRFAALRDQRAVIGWLCGLLHVELRAAGDWDFCAVAAPRSTRPGVGGGPVYFGDVIVAADSPFDSITDLRGGRFAYNETRSLSGYRMMIDHLASQDADLTYFRSTAETGSHAASLLAVADGTADCAIIDSGLIDLRCPGTDSVRVVTSVGPYPAPPLVAAVPHADDIRAALSNHPRWAPVTDDAYRGLRTSPGSRSRHPTRA